MAISYIGGATGTNSATLPTHAADDLIIGWAFRDGLAALPTVPSGWTTITTTTGTLCGAAIAYKIAASSGETSGTWTSADSLVIQVYRGADLTTPIGNSAILAGASTSNTVQYPALTFTDTSGSSWGMVAAGHRSNAGGLNLSVAPSGYTNRTYVQDATDKAAGFDTNGGATGFAGETVTVGGGSGQGWICASIEILEAAGGGINGDASGASDTAGAAAGSVSIAGAASGASNTTGAASGSVAISGAGAGASNTAGSAAGSVAISGTGSGASETNGAATGTVAAAGIIGSAAGASDTAGAASGSVAINAAGSGAANTTGAATGSVAIAAAAAGASDTNGAATGSVAAAAINGAASGAANTTGQATGSVAISGAGAGQSNTVGSSSASVAINGAAAGDSITNGSATGSDTAPVLRVIRMRVDGRLEAYIP